MKLKYRLRSRRIARRMRRDGYRKTIAWLVTKGWVEEITDVKLKR